MSDGHFEEYLRFDWKLKFFAIGVRGDYDRYQNGKYDIKRQLIDKMIEEVLERLAKKKKAKFDYH